MVNNPDSMWNRAVSQKKAKVKSLGAKEIMKVLGIEDEGPQDPSEKRPLKMMDIVYDLWGLPKTPEEEEEDDD